VTYYVHSTSTYNETHRLSGWYDVPLTKIGRKQSLQLKEIVRRRRYDAVFCSDLSRAYDTAKVAFGDRYKIIRDKRLRECNFGSMTHERSKVIGGPEGTLRYVDKGFPRGESYKDVARRVKSFMRYLLMAYPGKRIAIVSHEAPQFAFEVITKHKTWEKAIRTDWRNSVRVDGSLKGWRPGWKYVIRPQLR